MHTTLFDSKFVQSISAFVVSFTATLVDLGNLAVSNYTEWLELGQLITVYGGILFGTIRFVYWWKDRRRKIKDALAAKMTKRHD